MQIRLTLKHLNGSRANQLDTLMLPATREIVLGRDPECDIRYDETDDLVSRKHLKVVATDDRPPRYMVVDLGSRNGTFVNRQRVFGAVLLAPGGHVQLGAGGPEFEFGLAAKPLKSPPVRAVSGTAIRSGRMKTAFALFFLGLCAGGYAGWLRLAPIWRHWRSEQIARENRLKTMQAAVLASVIGVDAQWSVFDRQTGARLARAYLANEHFSHTALLPLLDGAPAALPAFILGPDRRIEPLLVSAGSAHAGTIVGGAWSSNGVIVSADGAVLTAVSRDHPWSMPWRWPREESAGVLLVLESTKIAQAVPLAASQFPRWIPSESGFFAENLSTEPQAAVRGRRISHNDLYVDVNATLTKSGRTVKAKPGMESSGVWHITPVTGNDGLTKPLLHSRAGASAKNQPVWVVGSEIENTKIQNVTSNGLLELPSSTCRKGQVIFDQQGRVLALGIPDDRSSIAIPIDRALALSGGAANGYPAQP